MAEVIEKLIACAIIAAAVFMLTAGCENRPVTAEQEPERVTREKLDGGGFVSGVHEVTVDGRAYIVIVDQWGVGVCPKASGVYIPPTDTVPDRDNGKGE